MKRILLSAIALMTFLTFYSQENQLNNQRLTASFEKQWSAPLVAAQYNNLELTEAKANKYQNPIDSYAEVFLDTSVKRKKLKNVPLRPPFATAFILTYRPR